MERKKPIVYIKETVDVTKIVPEATYPSKEEGRDGNIPYEIVLVQRTENRSEDNFQEVNNFKTGLIISPPIGLYVEIIATNSLHKHGYFLATGTSIINPGNTSELVIPLFKYKEVEDLELPFKAVQMIIRQSVYSHISLSKSAKPTRLTSGFTSERDFDPVNSGYPIDMQSYHSKGQPRSQGAPRVNNHMF